MKDDETIQISWSPIEVFDRINVDKSGSLDKEEIAMTLKIDTGDFVDTTLDWYMWDVDNRHGKIWYWTSLWYIIYSTYLNVSRTK